MQAFTVHTGLVVPMDRANVDTDAIIPKQFLKSIKRSGFGPNLFDEWRYLDKGEPGQDPATRRANPEFVLNQARYAGGSVLLCRQNFGCGSSREHAPQSLMRWGIHAVVAESFAEIFFGNCISLGIPAVTASRPDLEKLAYAIDKHPETEVTVDLKAAQLRCGDLTVPLQMPAAARESLVSGQWDFLGQLLDGEASVRKAADRIPYVHDFAAT